ncbi:GNAT family N-acetyltransferase [Streptomyces fructofermentans]|uniref:GCN5 family N-acetyltransferase n=1 Tax=Streptomyces fructofermentans TaxID=152141 RepID=A0A918K6P3_9ACTN|nr:GNAT family N-acetyltransferase [Streptomyces fructofermentans]GGX52341.1 GCN5 family N-acetyltransferase [Streptomyces fructofermentans]
MRIGPAAPADLPLLRDIERAAGEPFRVLGMAEIADDEPPPLDLLERFREAGHAWVVRAAGGGVRHRRGTEGDEGDEGDAEPGVEDGPARRVVAYLVGEPVDGAFHIEQVSVHPDAARRGVGRTLIAYAAERARDRGLSGLTLTTFTEVPWNAPYYERIGFRVLAEAELTPGLRRIRAAEAGHGLDRWPRVCMYRATGAAPATHRPPAADPGPGAGPGPVA